MGRIQKKSQEFRIRIEFLIHLELLRTWKSVFCGTVQICLISLRAASGGRNRFHRTAGWSSEPRAVAGKMLFFKLKILDRAPKTTELLSQFFSSSPRSRLRCSCKFKKIFTSIYGSSRSRNRQIVELQKCDAQYWLQHVSSPVAKRRRRRQWKAEVNCSTKFHIGKNGAFRK